MNPSQVANYAKNKSQKQHLKSQSGKGAKNEGLSDTGKTKLKSEHNRKTGKLSNQSPIKNNGITPPREKHYNPGIPISGEGYNSSK